MDTKTINSITELFEYGLVVGIAAVAILCIHAIYYMITYGSSAPFENLINGLVAVLGIFGVPAILGEYVCWRRSQRKYDWSSATMQPGGLACYCDKKYGVGECPIACIVGGEFGSMFQACRHLWFRPVMTRKKGEGKEYRPITLKNDRGNDKHKYNGKGHYHKGYQELK